MPVVVAVAAHMKVEVRAMAVDKLVEATQVVVTAAGVAVAATAEVMAGVEAAPLAPWRAWRDF